jgi:Aspartyl protease
MPRSTTLKQAFKPSYILATAFAVVMLCSCHICDFVQAQLPGELQLNNDAGRGGWLIVLLRLEDGKELPFLVDTGSSHTLFDKSLESQLKRAHGTATIDTWDGHGKAAVYVMPQLYAGNVPLITDNVTATQDFSEASSAIGRRVMGVLGIDCLSHYCVQLDFAAGKMRFLDAAEFKNQNWGKPFHLVTLRDGDERPAIRENLMGIKGALSQVDTGDPGDGWLRPKYFQQWTNKAAAPDGSDVRSPNARLTGENYPQVSLREADVFCDGIGLRFLSRHLVTFDFPKRMMYLRRTGVEPPADIGVEAAMTFLVDRIRSGRLPGWSKEEHGRRDGATLNADGSWTIRLRKNGDVTTYHYVVKPSSNTPPWIIERGWRTDNQDRTIEKYAPR